jgi:ankyrin repeat protein
VIDDSADEEDEASFQALGKVYQALLTGEVALLQAALDQGSAVDEKDRNGRTALHGAVLDRSLEMVVLLLRYGANVNAEDNAGWTPLHAAASDGQLDIARALLRASAEIDSLDTYGNTPLMRAASSGKENGEMISLLLENFANKNQKNSYGVSPYDLAKRLSNYDAAVWER